MSPGAEAVEWTEETAELYASCLNFAGANPSIGGEVPVNPSEQKRLIDLIRQAEARSDFGAAQTYRKMLLRWYHQTPTEAVRQIELAPSEELSTPNVLRTPVPRQSHYSPQRTNPSDRWTTQYVERRFDEITSGARSEVELAEKVGAFLQEIGKHPTPHIDVADAMRPEHFDRYFFGR